MELLQLKYFCDAAETENFSKTAEKYLVPTSNISQSIKRLEKELDTELFEHRANRIRLNEDGRQFYSDVSKALILLENAKSRIVELGEDLQGDINIACISNRRRVTNAIEVFLSEHPKVNFTIHHNFERNQSLDVIISDTCPFEYGDKILLVDEPICVAMNAGHPLAGKSNISVSDLEKERFITMTPSSSLHNITLNVCADSGFAPNIAIQTDDPFYLRRYIEIGLGISFVPSLSWKGLFSENIVLKSIDGIRRKTYAFLPKRKYTKSSVRAFLRVLQNQAEECLG